MNHSQRNLKKLIRAKEDSIADEELFLSAAYQKYQTSLARAVTGRYRYGLQVLLDWDISEQAGVAYTDNYKVHLNAANPITQSFPTRFLRSQSLTGLTGHEVGHLLYSDFTAHAVHLRSLENGSFYPKEPELSLPAYQTALEEIKEVLEEKDKAGCLTLARCAATFQNILEDIHIEDRMCEEFHGTFRQGIELNNLRMSEQIPSIQEQIDKEYQPFSIIANLILSYCRTGNINNPTGYQGDYLDTISDCTDLLDTAMESEKGTDRMLVSNALLALTWNYIQPLIEKTREELEMHGEDSAAASDIEQPVARDKIFFKQLRTQPGCLVCSRSKCHPGVHANHDFAGDSLISFPARNNDKLFPDVGRFVIFFPCRRPFFLIRTQNLNPRDDSDVRKPCVDIGNVFVYIFVFGHIDAARSDALIAFQYRFVNQIPINRFKPRFNVAVILYHNGGIQHRHDGADRIQLLRFTCNPNLRPRHQPLSFPKIFEKNFSFLE